MKSWKSCIAMGALVGLVGCSDEELALLAPLLNALWDTASITLDWDAVDGADSYDIYRGTDSNAMAPLETGYEQTTFTDLSTTAGTVYYYAVHATDSDRDSGPSNVAAGFPHTPPVGSGKVYENTSGQGSYWVFRMTGGVANGEDLILANADVADFGLDTHDGATPVVPSLLVTPFDPGDPAPPLPNGRVSQFALVQSGASQNDFNALTQGDDADYVWFDELAAEYAGLYLVKTEEGNYAKLLITSGDATSPLSAGHTSNDTNEFVEFEWDYNPNNEILF